jgi:hypothetical protein
VLPTNYDAGDFIIWDALFWWVRQQGPNATSSAACCTWCRTNGFLNQGLAFLDSAFSEALL